MEHNPVFPEDFGQENNPSCGDCQRQLFQHAHTKHYKVNKARIMPLLIPVYIYIYRTCQSLYIEVSSWMIRMESTTKHTRDSTSVRHRAGLFINGLLSAYRITHYVKTVMNYHSYMRKPMTKSTLLYLCKLLELLKVVIVTTILQYNISLISL